MGGICSKPISAFVYTFVFLRPIRIRCNWNFYGQFDLFPRTTLIISSFYQRRREKSRHYVV